MNKVQVIHEYDRIVTQLIDDIRNSHYKLQFFLELLQIKRGFFYKKMKEKRFTSEEVKTLSRYLYPEAYESYKVDVISKLLKASEKDIKEGRLKDINEVLGGGKWM
ncbi:hypothetical protein [Cochleicola gelatinilyticus]|uniref:Uncharacterized protein n=1 Tax=Cochleicola gelatinilyticus TaxID=1763537 RepID=A0A167J449_9FLAO|nr:hypothetical protein [Cochleicola gelatinilyticus]OAB80315.1 hypothetical protein ULVI_06150 [Cochleicola gelatinilyticus]